ncbi:MAG: Dabb family protein [Bacteroidales bacterium]|nr:Dabb family protein [Bacteroidales bacterium]
MKKLSLLIALFAVLVTFNGCCNKSETVCEQQNTGKNQLRHVVFFGFEESATPEEIRAIEEKFASLPQDIPFIKGYEWGTDCSPEGLQKGHSHCFLVTFASEADRDAYLIHPAHKELGKMLNGKLKNVTVIDYWVK